MASWEAQDAGLFVYLLRRLGLENWEPHYRLCFHAMNITIHTLDEINLTLLKTISVVTRC
jgi:hypothetical protein